MTDGLFNKDSILDYLSQDALIVLDEPLSIERAIEDFDTEADDLRTEKVERGELSLNFPRPYFTWKWLEPEMGKRQRLVLTGWDISGSEALHRLDFTPASTYAGQLPMFIKKTKQLLDWEHRLILVSHQASRLLSYLMRRILLPHL